MLNMQGSVMCEYEDSSKLFYAWYVLLYESGIIFNSSAIAKSETWGLLK